MQGLMQDWPLLVHTVLDHAARWHGEREIVSRRSRRTGPPLCLSRSRRPRPAPGQRRWPRLGLGDGEVIATMAWNTHRHLEIWYGLMGLGAVVHTLNPRLFADQLDYIVNHAEDRWSSPISPSFRIFEKPCAPALPSKASSS